MKIFGEMLLSLSSVTKSCLFFSFSFRNLSISIQVFFLLASTFSSFSCYSLTTVSLCIPVGPKYCALCLISSTSLCNLFLMKLIYWILMYILFFICFCCFSSFNFSSIFKSFWAYFWSWMKILEICLQRDIRWSLSCSLGGPLSSMKCLSYF